MARRFSPAFALLAEDRCAEIAEHGMKEILERLDRSGLTSTRTFFPKKEMLGSHVTPKIWKGRGQEQSPNTTELRNVQLLRSSSSNTKSNGSSVKEAAIPNPTETQVYRY